MAEPAFRRGALRRLPQVGGLVALAIFLGGCAAVVEPDNACAMANRDPSFQVLMQNSVLNIYNMCLEHMRQEIVTEWGEQ